ncbi:hypothetical protein LAWI1_G003795 [Lachnellula willkommii]|uniref:Uncharacterized protein n=1 Tax=Lachnellula willkommii TaxID=215461 RepID=A0A559M7F4_9HELO|nr:hypothetical protein LAWI1_G003795 [Lachnellula willkommii]
MDTKEPRDNKESRDDKFSGSLLYNFAAFFLPAFYETISKIWVAKIDPKQVIITDIYVYILVIASILNDGLPRAAWIVIGDKHTRSLNSRISLSYTLISFQMLLGLALTVVLMVIADKFADVFVPDADRVIAVRYVRASSVVAFSSAIEVAVSNTTRALDRPDVPLIINFIKFGITGTLDAIIISRVRIGDQTSAINHALIRMACDLVSGACGLVYFVWIADRTIHKDAEDKGLPLELSKSRPCLASLEILFRHGIWTFGESIIRNSLYLWLVHGIIKISGDYATAWGVFNTIRQGILMVPLQALEASTLTFIGHAWGRWRQYIGPGPKESPEDKNPKANMKSLFYIVNRAWASSSTGFVVEFFLFFLLFWAVKDFAYFLSGSHPVSEITQRMWRTMDWCYIFYAIYLQLSAILIATTPRFFFMQGLVGSVLWMLPWAIACSKVAMTEKNAWTYHGVAFGGSLIVDFFTVIAACMLWAWMMSKGWVKLVPVTVEVEDLELERRARRAKKKEKKEKDEEE